MGRAGWGVACALLLAACTGFAKGALVRDAAADAPADARDAELRDGPDAPPDAEAQLPDDTFSCLDRAGAGPLVKVEAKDHGYTKFLSRGEAGTRYDARGASWKFQSFPTALQEYPVDLRGVDGACWAGGEVRGTNPLDAGWGETYDVANGAGILLGVTELAEVRGVMIDGLRAHNVWDAIRPRSGGFHIKDVWLSYVRDDCVENDQLHGGTVEDSLFDGCYVGFSARSRTMELTGPSDEVWTIERTLVRLEPMPFPHAWETYGTPGHGIFFKWNSDQDVRSSSPKLRLIGNIFMAEQRANAPGARMGVPASVVECRDNIMVWLGEGDYPGDLRDCFEVTTDRSVWDDARAAWIARHPELRE